MKKLFSFADVIVICAVLIISVAGYACSAYAASGNKKYAVIEVSGEVFARYEMNMKTPVTVDVNGKNKVEISKDYVKVVFADCPDKLDVRRGKITKAGSVIICMPNEMLVRIDGKSDFDAISG